MALVAVLWIVSLLALMAAGTGSSGRVSTTLAFNAVENAKARLLADGGVDRALYFLLQEESDLPLWTDGSLNLSFTIDGNPVAVQVRDEDGKIDVNAASEVLLAGLLGAVGLEDDQATVMAARIADFRDDDSDARPYGAEDPAYQAAGLGEGAQDRPLRHLEELRRVIGMTDQLYERLRPHLTVYTDTDGLDPFRASETALFALPGMTPDVVQAIRANDDPDADILLALPGPMTDAFKDYVVPTRDLIFEIQALGQTAAGGLFLREAVVALDGGTDDRPFSVYLWRRGAHDRHQHGD